VIPLDTTPEAYAYQARSVRRMSPAQRLRDALAACDMMRVVCAEGVRRRHPEYDADRVSEEVGRIVLDVAPKFS